VAQARKGELVFLGLDAKGSAISRPCPPRSGHTAPASFNLWQALNGMEGGDMAIYGAARAGRLACPPSLLRALWRRPTAGQGRLAAGLRACGAASFPRTDPVVIMSVEHDADLAGPPAAPACIAIPRWPGLSNRVKASRKPSRARFSKKPASRSLMCVMSPASPGLSHPA
jgi:hypothetical protein